MRPLCCTLARRSANKAAWALAALIADEVGPIYRRVDDETVSGRVWSELAIKPLPTDVPEKELLPNTGVLVQDCTYMVAVPFFCPDAPPLQENPVFLYFSDGFQRPYPFAADIAVSIDDVVEKKIDAADALVSQVYEGEANGNEQTVVQRHADDPVARRVWLGEQRETGYAGKADHYRRTLITWYGPAVGSAVKYAEAFEICEYGRRPSEDQIRRLSPFFAEQ